MSGWRCSLTIASACLAPVVLLASPTAKAASTLDQVSHIVVVYLENHSFDNLLGAYPGAKGLADVSGSALQKDADGKPYEILPAAAGPFDVPGNPPEIRSLSIGDLPNRPFAIDQVRPEVTIGTVTRGLTHLFYTNRAQINGGANDRFALLSEAGGLTMGYYSAAAMENTNLWKAARQGVLFDNFFQGAFGGSFLNHIWFVCACPAVWPNPPEDQRSEIDSAGLPVDERRVTTAADGDYAVNTTQSVLLNDGKQGANLLPAQTSTTIADRLSDRGIDWAWYSEGWDLAIDQARSAEEEQRFSKLLFAYHHQPFAYFERFDPSTATGRAQRRIHLRDGEELETDILSGQLPPVSFYKPADLHSEHPGLGSVEAGDAAIGRVLGILERSPLRDSYAVIITYDENGGFFDHAPPPAGSGAGRRADFFGPGNRVPAILISPQIKAGVVNSTEFESTSVLKLITDRFQLDPLPSPRFGAVRSLAEAFESAAD